jgi:hypothetical protein
VGCGKRGLFRQPSSYTEFRIKDDPNKERDTDVYIYASSSFLPLSYPHNR